MNGIKRILEIVLIKEGKKSLKNRGYKLKR